MKDLIIFIILLVSIPTITLKAVFELRDWVEYKGRYKKDD